MIKTFAAAKTRRNVIKQRKNRHEGKGAHNTKESLEEYESKAE